MRGTGIKATAQQVETLKRALITPAVAIQCGSPTSPEKLCHSMALELGLPEIRGYYGIDLLTGEFMVAS